MFLRVDWSIVRLSTAGGENGERLFVLIISLGFVGGKG